MPQKRNPDIAELLRGKSGRAVGDVVALLTISKGLTLAYNKDLQESQEPLYDALETAQLSLAVLPGLIAGLEFDVQRMAAAAADPALGATDLAEELVRRGMPFRSAHEVIGRLVRRAEERKVTLRELDAEDLRAVDPALSADVMTALDPHRAVAARVLPGGPAPDMVLAEVARLDAELRALGYEP
jgi:argininosuccinate lyase